MTAAPVASRLSWSGSLTGWPDASMTRVRSASVNVSSLPSAVIVTVCFSASMDLIVPRRMAESWAATSPANRTKAAAAKSRPHRMVCPSQSC